MTPLLVEIIDHLYYSYSEPDYSDSSNRLWYKDKIGQIFEVVEYRYNRLYYERVDRKNSLDKYGVATHKYCDDFCIRKEHCKIINGIHKEEIERILSEAITC